MVGVDQLLLLSAVVTGVLCLVGLKGSWHRVFVSLGLAYAGLILASQYNRALMHSSLFGNLPADWDVAGRSGAVFAISLPVFLLLLFVAYTLMWGPVKQSEKEAAAVRLIQSVLTGAAGWCISAVLVVAILVVMNYPLISSTSPFQQSLFVDLAWRTTKIVFEFVRPWLPAGMPAFLSI